MNIPTKICMVLICSLPLLKAHSDVQESKETNWSLCRTVVKGGLFVAGSAVFETYILRAIGITASGIVKSSIAESVYNSLVHAKGLIITKDGFVDAFIWKYGEKYGMYGMNHVLSVGEKVYKTIDPYLDILANYVCNYVK